MKQIECDSDNVTMLMKKTMYKRLYVVHHLHISWHQIKFEMILIIISVSYLSFVLLSKFERKKFLNYH